jgi:N-methylhydantoinase B
LADDLTGSTLGDDVVAEGAAPGPGLAGGEDAGLNTLTLTAPDGSVRTWGSKERIPGIVEGTLVTCIMGGGAGYGNPFERPAEAVLSEVLDGLCSVGWAALHYGVVVDPTTGTVDRSATEARRSRR